MSQNKIIDELLKNPLKGIIETDFTYKELPEIQLKARIYRNDGAAKQPILIDVHGGAWNVGTRFDGVYYDRKLAARASPLLNYIFKSTPTTRKKQTT